MPSYGKSVFFNCPFDEAYAPILQAIAFCVIYLGFTLRIASERNDSGEIRVEKIQELIEASRYSIHDLSRCRAKTAGEYYRLNMPFELGMDYFCRLRFKPKRLRNKLLVLEKEPHRFQAALSDLAGMDIQAHNEEFDVAVRKVRNWLVNEAGAPSVGAKKIIGEYVSFQEWDYEKKIDSGFSEEDIKDYPTAELLGSMIEWIRIGKPPTFN